MNCGYRQLIWVSPINKNPMKYQGNELWKQTAYLGKSDEQERNEKPGNELWIQTAYLGKSDEQEPNEIPGK